MGQSSYKTVTSEFVQPKKSILWFRNNKFYFSFKKLSHCVVSVLELLSPNEEIQYMKNCIVIFSTFGRL